MDGNQIQQHAPLYLSHSTDSLYMSCPKAYYFRKVLRLSAVTESMNLIFGKAYHEAIHGYLLAELGGNSFAIEDAFVQHYMSMASDVMVSYSSIWDQDSAIATGRLLLTRFVEWWKASGYSVVFDKNGEPILERELRLILPDGIVYNLVIDAALMTPEFHVHITDWKSPAQVSMDGFACLSEQLKGYQVAVEAFHDELGIRIDGLAFIEGLKRKVPKTNRGEGPVIAPPQVVRPWPKDELASWVENRKFIADDIRRERFPRRPGAAFNTPCASCEYVNICTTGSREGLVVRPEYQRKSKTKVLEATLVL